MQCVHDNSVEAISRESRRLALYRFCAHCVSERSPRVRLRTQSEASAGDTTGRTAASALTPLLVELRR